MLAGACSATGWRTRTAGLEGTESEDGKLVKVGSAQSASGP